MRKGLKAFGLKILPPEIILLNVVVVLIFNSWILWIPISETLS